MKSLFYSVAVDRVVFPKQFLRNPDPSYRTDRDFLGIVWKKIKPHFNRITTVKMEMSPTSADRNQQVKKT